MLVLVTSTQLQGHEFIQVLPTNKPVAKPATPEQVVQNPIVSKEATNKDKRLEVTESEKQSPAKKTRSCSECSYTSSHQASINMHIRKMHRKKGDGGMSKDENTTESNSETVSIDMSTEQCVSEFIGEDTSNREGQSDVITSKRESPLKRKACSQCSYTSTHQASLNMHIRKMHRSSENTTKAGDNNEGTVNNEQQLSGSQDEKSSDDKVDFFYPETLIVQVLL